MRLYVPVNNFSVRRKPESDKNKIHLTALKETYILVYQIEKSDVILHRTHVLLLNIGCIGRHVILLSDVTKDGGRKCRVFKGKNGFIKALAPKSMQEKESNMRLWIY